MTPLPTKLAAACLAAGVISTGALIAPDRAPLPVVSADVANASVITDALYRFGDVVAGGAYGYAITQDAASSLPFDVATAFAIAAQNPTLSPSLLSWLVNRYVNPADSYPYWTYPWALKVDSIEVIAGALPFPLGPGVPSDGVIIDGANAIANAINALLGGVLPDPTAGVDATDTFWATDIGKTVVAANYAVTAPVWALYNTAYYLGYLPADLEATFESAIQNPAEIPGLLSNLVYGLLSSDGLVGDLIDTFASPLIALPGPIGVLADNVAESLKAGIDNVLSVLPAPITPTPLPSSAMNLNSVSDDTTADLRVTSLPDSTVSLDSAVTLRAADPVDTPDVPPTGGAAEPGTTGGAATGLVKDNDSGPLTNVVRDSIKVEPGDTFAGSGTVTGSEPESGTVTTGTVVESDPVTTTTPGDTSGSAEPGSGTQDSTDGDASASDS
ncbi:hypothetical protein [Mycolicibacterium sp. P1-18]|uniref:hypothetical protein n=1 Tax=Mycolicibacterium sp. P1-18 TaxID=2024615 RepID=UPI0011F2BFED|nr:hypothetical protein [Mycolicibacterium sp. P1-18]